jgi:hypothetical protein
MMKSSTLLTSTRKRLNERLYFCCALIFFVLTFWAFAKSYYLKALFNTPALTQLVHIHGIVMTGWVVLLAVQSGLVVGNRVKWHRRLGSVGAIWAILVLLLGSITTLGAAAREVRNQAADSVFQVSVLGLELLQMALFALLVGLGIWLRYRPDYHKRLMILTAACMLPSVIPRLPFKIHGFWLIYLYLALLVIITVLVDVHRNRRLHPALGWGAALILVVVGAGVALCTTPWWIMLGTLLVS